MALSKALEEMLALIEDQKDRDSLKVLLEKHEVLRERNEGYLRQSDYDKNFNKIKEEREQEAIALQNARDRAAKWEKWAKDNQPIHENLLTEYKKKEQQVKDLEEKVAEAAASHGNNGDKGGEVDEAKLMERVKAEIEKRGFVSKADVTAIALEEAKKLASEREAAFFKETLPASMEYSAKMGDFAFDHREEFGERFDRTAFAKFVTDKKINDLDDAYKQFVTDRRTEKKIKEETDKRVQAELSKRNLPGTGVAPSLEMGPIQMRRSGKDVLPADATIADAVAKAAEELRAEGKV